MRKRRCLIAFSVLTASAILMVGCASLFPKRDVMKTAVARTTSRKTSAPRVFQSANGGWIATGQEETVSTEVEYSKVTPVSASRSIWTRWWFWVGAVIVITLAGGWPFLIRLLRKMRANLEAAYEELQKKGHALKTVVKGVDVFKEKAASDPKANDVSELKTILSAQDTVTKQEVDAIRNGK